MGKIIDFLKGKNKGEEFPIRFSWCFNSNPFIQRTAHNLFSNLELYVKFDEQIKPKVEMNNMPFINYDFIRSGHQEIIMENIMKFISECDYSDGHKLLDYLKINFPEFYNSYGYSVCSGFYKNFK